MRMSLSNSTASTTYTLTTAWTQKPYLVVSDSYLPLTTKSSQGVRAIVESGTSSYRPMVYTSVVTSTTYYSSSTNPGNMSNTTALTRSSTSGITSYTASKSHKVTYTTTVPVQSSSSNSSSESHSEEFTTTVETTSSSSVSERESFTTTVETNSSSSASHSVSEGSYYTVTVTGTHQTTASSESIVSSLATTVYTRVKNAVLGPVTRTLWNQVGSFVTTYNSVNLMDMYGSTFNASNYNGIYGYSSWQRAFYNDSIPGAVSTYYTSDKPYQVVSSYSLNKAQLTNDIIELSLSFDQTYTRGFSSTMTQWGTWVWDATSSSRTVHEMYNTSETDTIFEKSYSEYSFTITDVSSTFGVLPNDDHECAYTGLGLAITYETVSTYTDYPYTVTQHVRQGKATSVFIMATQADPTPITRYTTASDQYTLTEVTSQEQESYSTYSVSASHSESCTGSVTQESSSSSSHSQTYNTSTPAQSSSSASHSESQAVTYTTSSQSDSSSSASHSEVTRTQYLTRQSTSGYTGQSSSSNTKTTWE